MPAHAPDRPAASAPPLDPERIARIEATLREVEDQGHRFIMLAESLRSQVAALKSGANPSKKKIKDWSFVRNW